jgi:serine phosphatase RsbU (regulator of sigma subunit)
VVAGEGVGGRAVVATGGRAGHPGGTGDSSGPGDAERLALLLEISTAVAAEDSHVDALRRLASLAVPALADMCLVDVIDDDGRVRRVAAVHADPAKQPLVDELLGWYPRAADGPHPGFKVIESGRPAWAPEMTDEFLRATTRSERHFELLKALGSTSYMAVPLVADGETLGSVTFVSAGSGRRFDEADLDVPLELAERVAGVVRSTRRRDRDHRIAHDLQARLLPRTLPWLPGIEMAASFLPSSDGAEVGGDFYDVAVLPSGRLGISVGDIAGHDADAAALMGQLRAAVRALAGQIREPPALVDALQWSWELLGFDRIATAIFARIDPVAERISAVSAGHPPPLVVSPAGDVAYLDVTPQPPLGCPAPPAIGVSVAFPTGSTILLYTDGLVERRGVAIDAGLDALVAAVRSVGGLPASELCDAVVDRMTGTVRLRDDAALLVIRSTG